MLTVAYGLAPFSSAAKHITDVMLVMPLGIPRSMVERSYTQGGHIELRGHDCVEARAASEIARLLRPLRVENARRDAARHRTAVERAKAAALAG